MNKILIVKLIVFVLISLGAYAQDPQFSQFYNAPLYLNPAFTGTAENTRLIFNYRSQWPGISGTAPYMTTAFSFDHNIESINSGVGLLFTRDRQGVGKLTSTDVALLYSYQIEISGKWSFRPALQATIVSRSIGYSGLLFGDQLTNSGPTGGVTEDRFVNATATRLYPDFSTGGLLFSDVMWFGLSAHHLNRPDQSFEGEQYTVPIKTSLQAGMRFPFGQQSTKKGYSRVSVERSVLPSLNLKNQGKFTQLDFGLTVIYEPVMFGVWYRGIPVKTFYGFAGNESFIFLAGIHYETFSFAYSYDITASKLGFRNSNGAHEISLIYEWNIPYPKKKRGRPLPCPHFYNKTKTVTGI
jgi:type IX secretion system PorP/SprF family membrane protein